MSWRRRVAQSAIVIAALTVVGTLYATWEDARRAREVASLQDVVRELQDSLSRCARWRAPADASALEEAARRYGVPAPLVWAMAWVESGEHPRAGVRGRHGELGRLQVRREIWARQLPECRSRSEDALVVCGVRILAALRAQSASWREAVARYNATAHPERAERYVRLVEQRLGRMYLEGLR
jgi:hypothetical protein